MNSLSLLVLGRLRLGFGLLIMVLLVGTAGFMLIEGWTPIEALYTSMLIVSTLGFSDIRPTDTPGRVLTMGLIIAGVGTLYYIVGALAQTVIENQLDRGKKRMMEHKVARLKQHFIVCGYGRVGQQTCRQLASEQHAFIVIDNNPERISRVAAQGYLYLVGDASNDTVLREAGVERARALLTAVHSDAANVYITLSARALNAQLFIVARASTDEAEHKLRIAGANRVISPYVLGGRSMAGMALRPALMDFLDVLVHSDDLAMWLEELPIRSDSPLPGLSVGDIQLRERAGLTILALRRADGQMLLNPAPDLVLRGGDTLIVLGARVEDHGNVMRNA
ncbi:MAG: potassium channel protein [Roseiflexaceae bacterium]